MPEEVNFVDLVALSKIQPDTVVERFGGMINSSFFDASNILGTLKLKGLIDFTTSFPGTSAITVTELGKRVLADAEASSGNEFNQLDLTLLVQLSQGKRTITDVGGAVNVRPNDLALHLYKLGGQGFLTYDFRNGTITLSLTEKGFMQAKTGMPTKPQPQAPPMAAQKMQGIQQAQPTMQTMAAAQAMGVQQAEQQQVGVQQAAGQPAAQGEQPARPTIDINQLEANIRRAKRRRLYAILVVAIVLIVFVALLALKLI